MDGQPGDNLSRAGGMSPRQGVTMLDPDRSLVIMCGASAWPKLPGFETAVAFANSARSIRTCLNSVELIPQENFLWLFDEPGAGAQYEQIENFITESLDRLGSRDGNQILILFIYVGHGALFGVAREYCLLLSDTRAPLEADRSLRVSSLSRLFKALAPASSRILILDCCFAGEAARAFQGAIDQVVAAKAHQVIDEDASDRGVALLCASSARNPARLDSPDSFTLFGRALVAALSKGDPKVSGPLSLRELCNSVTRELSAESPGDYSRPEVHAPDQAGGDIAAKPLFVNPSYVPTFGGHQGTLIYDSDDEPNTFQTDWGYFDSSGRFDRFFDLPGTARMEARSGADVGLQKRIPSLRGEIELEFLVTSPSPSDSPAYFCAIPMQSPIDSKSLIEVGATVQADPRNPKSKFRSRWCIPEEYYNDGRWHIGRFRFDFQDTPTARYAIFAPRINEGVDNKADATVVLRRIRIWDLSDLRGLGPVPRSGSEWLSVRNGTVQGRNT